MAQNITLMGANYEDVPSVTLPRTGGGTASFVDIGDTTASASDVLEGKVMYTASGIRTIGTGAIGGGVPSGGITNEVLTKVSSTDYDVTWSSIPVQSVNNQIGVIMLTASDVGALPSDTAIPSNAADVGALPSDTFIPSVASDVGAIPAPASASSDNVLAYNGSAWVADKRTVILSYGHSTWAEFLSAYNANAVIYCRASSNNNPATGSQTRMAFMAYVSNADNPTNVEFQYYRSVNTHSATQQGDQMYVYKLDKTAGWTVTVRESYTKIVAGTGLSSSYASSTLTLTNAAAVPSDGTAGQVLTKNSSGYGWADASDGGGLPSGGTSGQFLKKNSSTDGDAVWETIRQVPTGGVEGFFLMKTYSGYGWYGIDTPLVFNVYENNGNWYTDYDPWGPRGMFLNHEWVASSCVLSIGDSSSGILGNPVFTRFTEATVYDEYFGHDVLAYYSTFSLLYTEGSNLVIEEFTIPWNSTDYSPLNSSYQIEHKKSTVAVTVT